MGLVQRGTNDHFFNQQNSGIDYYLKVICFASGHESKGRFSSVKTKFESRVASNNFS